MFLTTDIGPEPALYPGSSKKFLILGTIVFCFFVISLTTVLKHEMWRDELQDWLLATHSQSVKQLICHMYYEGHPALWHLSLYVLGKFVEQPVGMQIFHVIVATATVLIILRYAPFPLWQNILLVFGYFLVYEYAVISRNYVLQMFFFFGVCALYSSRRKHLLWIASGLFLLCQTNVFGMMIAFSFWGIILVEYLFDKSLRQIFAQRKTELLVGTLIVLFGMWATIVQVMQPPDSGFAMSWRTTFDGDMLKKTIATIWDGFVPLPQLKMGFWNSNILDGYLDMKVGLAVPVFLLCCLLLCRKPLSLLLFLISSAGILTFFYTKYLGFVRHFGQFFIIFIGSLWISYSQQPLHIRCLSSLLRERRKLQTLSISAILFLHVMAAGIAIVYEWQYPFSASQEAALYLKKQQLTHHLLVGDADYAASSVAGHLGKEFYYPAGNRFGTFIIWDKIRRERLHPQEVLERAMYWAAIQKKDVVFVLNYPVVADNELVQQLAIFPQSIVPDEQFALYLVRNTQKQKD